MTSVKMPFTDEDKHLIKVLRQDKRYSSRRFLKKFPNRNWTRRGLDELIKKIDSSGSVKRATGSGRVRTVRSDEAVAEVADLIQSQEDQPRTHLSVRQIAREVGMSRTSVHRVITSDLKLKCLKRERAQELTEANRSARLERSRQLLKKYPPHAVEFIWFSDEKLFTVAAPSNPQNDRLYVQSSLKKREVSASRLLRTRPTFSKSVMVSVAVSSMGCSQIHFLEPGVKINGEYYRNVVLKEMLLPDIRSVSGDCFVFQQDGAPAHRARDTVELLRMETPDFITPELWPPNSPDLNPVDYSVWSVIQEKVYQTRIADIDELKQRLLQVWAGLDHGFIAAAIGQWRRRLNACVKARGGHFEHLLL